MATARLPHDLTPAERLPIGQLFEPTHQNRLRVAGRALDERGLELAAVLDLGDAVLIRGYDPATGELVAEILPDADLHEAMHALIHGPRHSGPAVNTTTALRPTGYEDFLRALGYRLDHQGTRGFAIIECARYIHVSGLERIGTEDDAAMVPFAHLYEAPKVNSLVNEAISRRDRTSLTGGLSVRNIEDGALGRVMHSTGLSR